MMDLTSVANALGPIYTILEPVVPIALLAVGGVAVQALQKHGYSTTYANAVLRAAGAGVAAAQAAGVDPLSAKGRAIAGTAGAQYLASTVGDTAAKLGITTAEDHATRVVAQIQTMQANAMMTATAAATVAAVAPAITAAVTPAKT